MRRGRCQWPGRRDALQLSAGIGQRHALLRDDYSARQQQRLGLTDVSAIISLLESGNAYINVHTLQSLPGEIRGQVW